MKKKTRRTLPEHVSCRKEPVGTENKHTNLTISPPIGRLRVVNVPGKSAAKLQEVSKEEPSAGSPVARARRGEPSPKLEPKLA